VDADAIALTWGSTTATGARPGRPPRGALVVDVRCFRVAGRPTYAREPAGDGSNGRCSYGRVVLPLIGERVTGAARSVLQLRNGWRANW
jgi:hypothetical protein